MVMLRYEVREMVIFFLLRVIEMVTFSYETTEMVMFRYELVKFSFEL